MRRSPLRRDQFAPFDELSASTRRPEASNHKVEDWLAEVRVDERPIIFAHSRPMTILVDVERLQVKEQLGAIVI